MHTDFLEKTSVPIPHTQNLSVDMDGNFLTTDGLSLTPQSDQTKTITVDTNEGPVTVRAVVLKAIAFKQCKVPSSLWHLIDVGFVDNDPTNEHPGNMVISFPIHGIEHPAHPGMYFIPFYTRYLISRQGIVFDTLRNMYVTIQDFGTYESTKSMEGYRFFSNAFNDVGKKSSLSIHRALCLAFKGVPVNVDKLDVNHEDDIKSNSELDNLEWRTRRYNNLHATELGMRPDNHTVVMKSIYTGEERTYFSLWECARALKVHGELIRYRCLSEGQVAFPPGLLFKKVSCPREWVEVPPNPEDLFKERTVKRSYLCTDVLTNEVRRFDSGTKISQFLHIRSKFLESVRASPTGLEARDSWDGKRFHVRVMTFEQDCESLFAEKQCSYLS